MGWRLDAGFKHRKIHLVLDYESARCKSKGFGRPIQVYMKRILLYQSIPRASKKNLRNFGQGNSFWKTVGCKGSDRIAEGVKHSEACHERFRSLLEKEKGGKQKEALKSLEAQQEAGEREFAAIEAEIDRNLFESQAEPSVPAGQAPVSCDEKSNDYWEFDKEKGAWCKVHVRPRKRLFAPVGNDCPFNAKDIGCKRITDWRCRNRVSTHQDDWQVKLAHTKEFVPEVGLAVHGFSHQTSWMKGVPQSKQQLQMQRTKGSSQEGSRQLSS